MIYEVFAGLPDEVRLIWAYPFNWNKVVYILLRYGILACQIVATYGEWYGKVISTRYSHRATVMCGLFHDLGMSVRLFPADPIPCSFSLQT
jgi:hypothetical protein